MKDKQINLKNRATLQVTRYGPTVRLALMVGPPACPFGEVDCGTGAYFNAKTIGVLIEELEKIREEIREPQFEPVTIALNTPDEVKALTGILGKLTRKATASALGVHDMDHRAYAVDVAFNALYRFLSDKADGYPD